MKLKNIYKLLLAAGVAGSMLGLAGVANASAFQLYEQDGAGVGDYHAGGAASADTASTEWYNPAGMIRLKHQQLSIGGTIINTNIPFSGTVETNTVNPGAPVTVNAQGGGFNFVPNMHYVAPINDDIAVGFGINVPFGLKTDYGAGTNLRYVATLTKIQAIDITPAIAFRLNRVISLGIGLDFAYVQGEFNQVAGLAAGPNPAANDTTSVNKGHDWGKGAHFGLLAQFTPSTRFGLAYHTQIVNHMKGASTFKGPLANGVTGGTEINNNLRTDFTLPAWTEFSAFHQIDKKWSIMGTVMYTQWSVFKQLTLRNVAAVTANDTRIVVNENYRNTWNVALGAHYQATQKWLLKAGVGWDETPSRTAQRNVQLPDSNRIALALGAQYQVFKNLFLDAGYTHLFSNKAAVNVTQRVDIATTTTIGSVKGDANIIGLQLIWNIT